MKLSQLIKYGFAIFIGSIIGFLTTRWSFFEFDSKIVLLDLINVVVTAFLVYYVASTLQKKQDSTRIEKDLLISQIFKVREQVEKVHSSVLANHVPFDETVALFKNISSGISTIEETLDICKVKKDCGISHLQKTVRTLKADVTNSSVANGFLIIGNIIDIDIKFKNALRDINRSVILVNRHDHN